MRCGQEDKSLFFSVRTVSLEGKPQPLTALSAITCCYSHTQELSILSSVSLQTRGLRSSYPPPIYTHTKKQKNITLHLWECARLGLLSHLYRAVFLSLIYRPSFAALTTTLACVSLFHLTLREGVSVKTKDRLSRDATLHSIFLSLSVHFFSLLTV